MTRKRRVFMILMIVFCSLTGVYLLMGLATALSYIEMFPVFLMVSFIFLVPFIVFLCLFLKAHGDLKSDKAIASASRRGLAVSPKNLFSIAPTFQKTFQTLAYPTTVGIDEPRGLVQFFCPTVENGRRRKKLTPVFAIERIKDLSVYSDGVSRDVGKAKESGKAMADQNANIVEIFFDGVDNPYLSFDFGSNRGECFRFFETLKLAFRQPRPKSGEKN